MNFLQESCASANPGHREVGIYCLYTLFEVAADFFMNNTGSLFELFNKMIVDPDSKSVRITTVLVLGKLSEFVDSEDKSTIVSLLIKRYISKQTSNVGYNRKCSKQSFLVWLMYWNSVLRIQMRKMLLKSLKSLIPC
jgi:hypothetical protein